MITASTRTISISMNNRLLVIALVIMVVLNIVVVSVVISHKGHHPRHGRTHGGDPFVERLQLSDDQASQFKALKHAHRESSKKRHEQISDLREDMFAEMGKDSAKATELAKDIGNLIAKQEHSFYVHFSELRELCTPEQQERFDDLMKDISRSMGAPPPRRPPGPPRH